ncbi:conserved exported hypothetical protein [Cupriavidus taiwanensis]|uniref:hypothetical protein n=1 Tax=Cupriavidus taiwanensis TaxID=164546 RepID=UPI000E141FB9|nr:hypothetical protein [Cupriavidus taiwanensis]SOZ14628.1 conserved exported hypothetical protein [Cupriavidus taiwanensis]SOZ26506.1 conserved exported hypothetical protein [Cupriavidus taiwanensis]SOZ41010.1 conserved exported hypothetical protein [Cupriavidus taiwanensis]SPA10237.1 conserved exported hypothetical protein [Cupriavidus taiwanensis]
MEKVRPRRRRALAGAWVALALLPAALNARVALDGDTTLRNGMQRYVISMRGCAVEFVAKTGGYADLAEPSPSLFGYFRHNNHYPKDRYDRTLHFSISCHAGAAKEICPKLMKAYRGVDKTHARDIQFRRLGELNPRYYSEAYIQTWSAIAPPRPRTLGFCMGDEHRAVMTENGDVLLGYDPRELTETRGKAVLKQSERALPDVLAIMRSMRFVPDPPAPEPPR